MTTWLIVWGLPLLTLALARWGRSRKLDVFMLTEYAAYAVLLFAVEMGLLVPLERITVRWFAYGYTLPEITYGRAAIAAMVVLAAALGLLSKKFKDALGIYSDVCPKKKPASRQRTVHLICMLLLLLLVMMTVGYFWARANYGNVSLEEIIFHLNMPMKGTDTFVASLTYSAILPAVVVFVLLMLLLYMPVRHTWWVRARVFQGAGICLYPGMLRILVFVLCVFWTGWLWSSANRA